jgi:hypothetical protein
MTNDKHYAAVGTDGIRPVVWGIGDSYDAARVEAREQLANTDPEYRDDPLVIVEITAEQRACIEAGEVSAEKLGIDLSVADVRQFMLGGLA